LSRANSLRGVVFYWKAEIDSVMVAQLYILFRLSAQNLILLRIVGTPRTVSIRLIQPFHLIAIVLSNLIFIYSRIMARILSGPRIAKSRKKPHLRWYQELKAHASATRPRVVQDHVTWAKRTLSPREYYKIGPTPTQLKIILQSR
jgi:hypothetical protein